MNGFVRFIRVLFKVWCVIATFVGFSIMSLSIGSLFYDRSPMMVPYAVMSLVIGFLIFVPGLCGLFKKQISSNG
ncbi:hypothetical protein R6242_19540 [Iodobacter sp. CM08]|uniref:hypothetical protein n=1 Tax=Iodobacter sp. CM08 TaxID=3085902 RepID=UPI002981FEBB|nr:hypothetical protein [Iodobacter sp. CM08]MDW5418766.1 hypothetical protein [Iodobacter sp. CM08]